MPLSPQADAAAAGTGGAATAAIFGDAIDAILDDPRERLDLTAIDDALGIACLAPLASWAAKRDPLAAYMSTRGPHLFGSGPLRRPRQVRSGHR